MKKSYVDQHRELNDFKVGEHVYLHIKSKRRSLRIASCFKLTPRYCKTFEILEMIAPMTYRFSLPLIVKIHDFFHVSLLKRYMKDVDHMIEWSVL